ncbi:uncharacterized protein EDB93DRAFT_1100792 [Suillus bovinus]|uniref:uncharacterized protein n=1 Tax=Suillus bovinus TaxID=48563 RepID=UPI001B8670E1|nr:uncharacterized protein EDB93DRAFT_1100792 [Suillus bovinus]KAG2157992.1 hypothetical protein EDB93DRAFT_1100792 [Suillus bovinus]
MSFIPAVTSSLIRSLIYDNMSDSFQITGVMGTSLVTVPQALLQTWERAVHNFYMQSHLSHGGLIRISRLSHYIMLRDDAYTDIACEHGTFHFNPAMGFDTATISSNDNTFNLGHWRKNFKDRCTNLSKKMHFM